MLFTHFMFCDSFFIGKYKLWNYYKIVGRNDPKKHRWDDMNLQVGRSEGQLLGKGVNVTVNALHGSGCTSHEKFSTKVTLNTSRPHWFDMKMATATNVRKTQLTMNHPKKAIDKKIVDKNFYKLMTNAVVKVSDMMPDELKQSIQTAFGLNFTKELMETKHGPFMIYRMAYEILQTLSAKYDKGNANESNMISELTRIIRLGQSATDIEDDVLVPAAAMAEMYVFTFVEDRMRMFDCEFFNVYNMIGVTVGLIW